jgi:diamine N-acetyltransferase
MSVRLVEITDDNRAAVLGLTVTADQQRFVGPSVQSALDDATAHPEASPWYRAVYDHDRAVGFVMLSWDCAPAPGILGPWYLWKLLIDSRHQGRGYGAQAVHAVAALVAAQGAHELLTSYVPGPDGPEGFYERLGFVPTGDIEDGEIVAALSLGNA